MPGSADRPPDIVTDLRALRAKVAELNHAVPRSPVIVSLFAAAQPIPSGASTDVEFAVAEIDNANTWTPGTPTQITIPRTGIYLVSAYARFDTSTAGERQVAVVTSGAGQILAANGPAENLAWQAAPSAPIGITEATTVSMTVYQNTGSPLDLDIGRLGIVWLGTSPS